MTFNEIPAQDVLYEIEAALLNERNKTHSEKEIMDLIRNCLEMQIVKVTKNKKKKTAMQVVKQEPKNVISNSNDKTLRFEYSATLNEKHHNLPMNYNNAEMHFNTASEMEILEYTFIPKDEKTYLDEYKNYFETIKSQIMAEHSIGKDDTLLDIDKFILLVTFENTDEKIAFSSLVFIDPMNDYKRYSPKFENLDVMREYHFFSGQIIYVNGQTRNDDLYVNKIEYGMEIQTYNLKDSFVMAFYKESSPYLIHILNGPIFNRKEINLDLFIQTLNSIAMENPHALILSGPFVNIENSALTSGDIKLNANEESSMNYFEFFEFIIKKINDVFASKKTIIIMCPSLLDITNYYPLPQPPFNLSQLKNINNYEICKKKRLKMISNPQIFQLNEIYFGVANFDVLKDMISNSVIKEKSPMDSSLEMLLRQRSFYPVLSTTASEDDNKTINIDYKRLDKLYMKDIPDIIITPSSLQSYVKKIHSTYFVNPGTLYKGNNTGSFAKISIFPPSVIYI
jgi:hypothetical protein